MNNFSTILVAIFLLWILVSWMSYFFGGWHKWERLFQRKFTANMMRAQRVYLRRFGAYNNCIRIWTDTYGVGFATTKILLFHKRFCIPWAQILSYEIAVNRRSRCTLHTTQGDIKIYGDVGEIIARECAKNYVKSYQNL